MTVALLLAALLAAAQAPTAEEKLKEPSEPGISVTSALVEQKCGACHKKDDKGNLTRISWERTTPEGWQQVVKRMVRLHGVVLTPDEARSIVKYLSTNHGLAPEEARPVAYMAERRMIDETIPHDYVRDACAACHAYGRPMSWRRSKEEWDLLVNMHIAYFPVTEFTSFRRPPPGPNAPPPAPGTDTRDPVVKAIEYIAKTYPLRTTEWAAWRASMREPKLSGRWLVTGRQLGRGRIYGEVTMEPTGVGDEFTTRTTLRYVKDGATTTRTGRAIVYTGYAWRGRSESRESGQPKELREVMMVSRDQSQIDGRWFWGGYDEFGMDITLRRAGTEPALLAVDRTALHAGSAGQQVRLFSDNLPDGLSPADVDFGSGVSVKQVRRASSTELSVEVDVAKDAILGKRDVAVRRAVLTGAVAVYDKVDYVKVTPEAALARLGGAGHPKGYQQFEASAWNRGPDNKPRTNDDVDLGPVDVEWSVEEFLATYGDDDRDFVGKLSPTGLFTPAEEGPNPKRQFARNNYGDIWVVATYKPEGAEKDAKPITGRAHLVVSIPLYVRWDQPEVAE